MPSVTIKGKSEIGAAARTILAGAATIRGEADFGAGARTRLAAASAINGAVEISGGLRDVPEGRPEPKNRYKCPLGVFVDTDETRIKRDALTTWVAGKLTVPGREQTLWGWPILENLFVEPFEGTLMKLPASKHPDWSTSTIAPFNKFGAADFTFSEPTKWSQYTTYSVNCPWLRGLELTPGSTVTTKADCDRNRGIYTNIYLYGSKGTGRHQIPHKRIKWLRAGVPYAVSFEVYREGRIEMFYCKGTDPTVYRGGSVNIAGSKNPQDLSQRCVQLFIIPFRRREILILTGEGEGGILECPWIEESDVNPEITPKGKVQMEFVVGGAHTFEFQFLSFVSSGKATAIKTTFKEPPGVGELYSYAYYMDQVQVGAHATTIQLVEANSIAVPFVADGVKKEARVQISISGDTNSTPFLAGIVTWYKPLKAVSPGPDVEITNETSDICMEWGEHPKENRATLSAWNPAGSAAPKLATRFNRPADIRLCGQVIIRGPLQIDQRERMFTAEEAEEAPAEIGSLWDQLQNGRFTDVVPFDNLTITEAFQIVAEYAGLGPGRFRVSSDPFRLSLGNAVSTHEFALAAQPGDTFAQWFDRLRDDFCATWWMGFELVEEGNPRLCILKPDDLEATAAATVYLSEDDAEADGVDPALTELTRRYLIRHGWKERYIPPEANSIWITGYDVRKARPIAFHKEDKPSQDIELAEGARPDNWLGWISRFSLQDPAITSQAVAERAANIAFDRLTKRRKIATVTAGWWFDKNGMPLVSGRRIKVRRRTSTGPDVWETTEWRIKKVRVRSMKEPKTADSVGSEGWMLRNVDYVLEQIGEDLVDKGGADLKLMKWDADFIAQIRSGLPKWIETIRTRPSDGAFIKGLPVKVTQL